ncbi:MAG: T9SS type A sorting domain-containing protein, partial [Saprospiraceae bacterium]|nr:T9SS type A sorting domain-containing protein [Saprospiraceae bacterium]
LPLWLGPFRSGEKEVLEFLVMDSLNRDCVLETTVDGSPCQHSCSIGALQTEIVQCDSGLFSISIDFEYSGAVSDSFKLKGNGQFYGLYAYSDLPVQLEALKADGTTKYEFVVVDQQAACRNYVDLGTVDCFCLWSDLAFYAGDCTSDSTYAMKVNFTPGNVDSFNLVTGGRHLGTFGVEELPLTIENFPASGGTFDELWICASLTNCCERFDIESPICARKPCSISEVQVTPLECAEGQHRFLLDFAHEGNASDHFLVKKNNEWVGRYKYAELPVKIGPFWGMDSSTYILKIIDAINEDCVSEIEVIDPGCHDCHVGDIKVEVGECTSDSTYRIILNPEIQGAFDFYVNGHFCGTFDSGALPLTIDDFPASGEAYDYIKICGLDSSYCCKEKKIESPVCARSSCPFEDVRFELTECDSNNIFYATIFLDTFGLPEGTFIVQRENALLEFSYASLPVRIGPLQGGETFYKYKIYDAINTQCRADLTIGRVICPSQCDLEVGRIDIAECNEEEVILLIDSVQGSYPGFDVTFGDQYLGFHKKEQLPLRLKAKLSEQGDEVSVKICVSDNITCCVEKSLSLSNCGSEVSCGIGALQFDTVECRNDSFYVNLNFIDNNVDSGSYLLKINGERWDEFSSADLPLHVGPLAAGADRKYSILVQSGLNEGCVAELEFGGVECPASSLEAGLRLLVVQSNNFTNYIKVPDFISDRSIFQLFDLGGRLMYEMEFSADTRRALVQVPVNVAGMYLVKIKAKDGQQHLSKIIVP